jgi:hypothetical protein
MMAMLGTYASSITAKNNGFFGLSFFMQESGFRTIELSRSLNLGTKRSNGAESRASPLTQSENVAPSCP